MQTLKSPSSDPDSLRSLLKEYFSLLKQFTQWKRFRETRDSIKREEDLFDLSDEDLKQFGLMTPFAFNLYETVLAALPAQVSVKVFNFLFPFEAKSPETTVTTVAGKEALRDAEQIVDAISLVLGPLLLPVILLSMSWVVSEACLKDSDSTKSARRRCKRAYQYYNGAYSLIPQTLIALSITFWRSSWNQDIDSIPVFVTFIGLLCVSACYQLYVTYYKIPSLLFDLNGYAKIGFSWKRRRKHRNPSPYYKYVSYVFSANALLSAIAMYVVPILMAAVAILIALLKFWVKRRF